MEGFKELRIKVGLKQYELAQKIGVSVVSLRKYEQGKTFPKPQILLRLSAELSVNIEVLYSFSKYVGVVTGINTSKFKVGQKVYC